jgi:prepilin signal peptidase PulO-like enzyme (type II secretory pathway)
MPVVALVAVLASAAGGFVNWAIYSLAYFQPRAISPWSQAPEPLARDWLDRVPIFGWLRLRRESQHWGRGFWVRPLLIEATLAVGIAWLYHTELSGALLPAGNAAVPSLTPLGQWISHTLLILLMTVATFIDFDEKTIPDWITTPGTLLGLVLMTAWPLAGALPQIEFQERLQPLWLTTFSLWWQEWLDQWPGLVVGIACLLAWCYALVPKTFTLRRGWRKAWTYFHVSTLRSPLAKPLAVIAVVGSLVIAGVWLTYGRAPIAGLPPTPWRALLTSLVGMAFGGALVWAVRIVGYLGLRKEAMGFGDVTLMAMIGAFLGWQSTILVFFLAPFAAVVIAVTQTLLTGRRDIAFGPYLCAGALILILYWQTIWENWGAPVFGLGWIVPALLVCGLGVMLGLLMLIRLLEEAFWPEVR